MKACPSCNRYRPLHFSGLCQECEAIDEHVLRRRVNRIGLGIAILVIVVLLPICCWAYATRPPL